MDFVQITQENLAQEHLCCAIADKKHQSGVESKKQWLKGRLEEGHVFYKLNAKGKVFIEYAPLETAWVPVTGDNYLYIYCLWVAGSYKGKGYGAALLSRCIEDAKAQGKSGVCIRSAKKKKPFAADPVFMRKYGFETVDEAGGYELMALSLDGSRPAFTRAAKQGSVDSKGLHIFYGPQCPFCADCAAQVEAYCQAHGIAHTLQKVDSLEAAKALPGVFNNWATFYDGAFVDTHPLNEGLLAKLLAKLQG